MAGVCDRRLVTVSAAARTLSSTIPPMHSLSCSHVAGANDGLQEISAVEKETRLEAILPDTTSLCDQIELKSKELKQLLERIEASEEERESIELDHIAENEIFVLEQVRWLSFVPPDISLSTYLVDLRSARVVVELSIARRFFADL